MELGQEPSGAHGSVYRARASGCAGLLSSRRDAPIKHDFIDQQGQQNKAEGVANHDLFHHSKTEPIGGDPLGEYPAVRQGDGGGLTLNADRAALGAAFIHARMFD